MTLEGLPEVIQENIISVVEQRFPCTEVKIEITKRLHTEISCSCNVRASDWSGKTFNCFVKYLNRSGGEFSKESLVYFNNEIVFYREIVGLFQEIGG